MTDKQEASFRETLKQILDLFPENLDFTRADSESVREIVKRLTAATFAFNLLAVDDLGGRYGPEREPGLVEQVVAAAFQTSDGIDLRPHYFEKAAVLIRGITLSSASRARSCRRLTQAAIRRYR